MSVYVRPPPRPGLARAPVGHHLHGPGVHLGCRETDLCRIQPLARHVGLGDGCLLHQLRPAGDSQRRVGRPVRAATRVDPHRGLVVDVHHPDRRDVELLRAAGDAALVRRRRGRGVPECHGQHASLVSDSRTSTGTRLCLGRQPRGRSLDAVAGRAADGGRGLARRVLSVRRNRLRVGGGVVVVVSKPPGRTSRGRSPRVGRACRI